MARKPPASTLVLLVRHGQTPTTGTVLPGRAPDLHLSDAGRAQAGAAAERLQGLPIDALHLQDVVAALSSKDAAGVAALSRDFPQATRHALQTLLALYGGDEVLAHARRELPPRALITQALDDLQWLATHLQRDHAAVRIGFDLSDLSGYAYYSGTRFAIYGGTSSEALARGGRYTVRVSDYGNDDTGSFYIIVWKRYVAN